MRRKVISLGVGLALLMAIPALADWNPEQPYKWLQMPDLSPMGIDVSATQPYILADDFLCTVTGPITDIHIWGSWLNDHIPFGDFPDAVRFTLSIHKDIPDPEPGNPDTYSMPGEVLWVRTFYPGEFAVRIWQGGIEEGWLNPPAGYWFPADWTCWQYNFFIDAADAFHQEGTSTEPVVYWLDVQAVPEDADAQFGWKTSLDHWNDDAVWGQGIEPYPGPWSELIYPPTHEMHGQSIDLAFVITGQGQQDDLDFGDAPEGVLAYPSLGVNGWFPTCMYVPPAGWIQHGLCWAYFGPSADFEPDGNGGLCPFFAPYDNDECFQDGDAGLLFPEAFTIQAGAVTPCPNSNGTPLGTACQTAVWGTDIDILITNTMPVDGLVNVLMDWNQDGQWAGGSTCPGPVPAPEHVLVDFPVPAGYAGPLSGLNPPPFLIGPDPGTGGTTGFYVWSRFSVTEIPVGAGWDGSGSFEDGETEDYLLYVLTEEEPTSDLGDAPDSSNNFAAVMTAYPPTGVMAGYPTVFGAGSPPYGPIHWQPLAVAYLGDAVTLEQEADIGLDQDPTNNIDPQNDTPDLDLADDGVTVPLTLPHCDPQTTFDYTVTIVDNTKDLYVNVWFDWLRDGDWDDTPECPDATLAPEWAVQNQLLSGFPAPGQYTITTPPFVPWHPTDPPEEIWMRITISEQRWQSAAGQGYGGSGPSGGYTYGETEDYYFLPDVPHELGPKWSQLPHGPYEGFDAASDLWWQEPGSTVKWEQLPNPELPGIHAHDWFQDPSMYRIILADDWLCEGGVVTDFHWWGAIEDPGAGVAAFRLSIHYETGNCLPADPPYWWRNVPITQITQTPTGIFNSVGLEIIRYDYDLPQSEWFYQEQGQTYWFNVSAISVDPMQPHVWLWQESARVVPPGHTLCPASQWIDPTAPYWQWITWADDRYSDMAFRVTSKETHEEVNKVVADDFISDGRPIEAVRWWGSYLDELFKPEELVEPYVVDGWFISFHHAEPVVNPDCPPDLMAGDPHPTVLGVYFAPFNAVQWFNMGYLDCFGEEVYQYFVDLEQCCLLCAQTDPRDGATPAQDEAFFEVASFGYWLDIQAVVGVTWVPPACGYNDRILTGHEPSATAVDRHFWGWHTGFGPGDPCEAVTKEACTGRIVDFGPYPPECWDYGDWVKQPWLCDEPPPPQPVHMAFELLTGEPDPCPTCPGDMNGDGIVNGEDIQGFVDCLLDPVGAPGTWNCPCGDFNCSKTVDIGDVPGFVAELLNTTVCP
ncbi:MAG: hypothetical protein JXQ75_23090 [Phycisphaerae bacterium]|nr:hypothetical protein [Phycisphaerae bacterium]